MDTLLIIGFDPFNKAPLLSEAVIEVKGIPSGNKKILLSCSNSINDIAYESMPYEELFLFADGIIYKNILYKDRIKFRDAFMKNNRKKKKHP